MDHLVLFCRDSQEEEYIHLDMSELTLLSFFLKPQGPQAETKLSQHGPMTVAQLNVACERPPARLPVDWLETFKP